jgi:lysozyme family protein
VGGADSNAEPGNAKYDVLAFEQALAHVLEMEGGFTDDPDDPGGPTNKGIILRVFCDHTRRTLNEFTRRQCVEALRAISDETVKEIYRERYWQPSRAAEMPAAIGFMHFDASVNHGLTGAARLLQRAVARQDSEIKIDGEIGPLTMAAVHEIEPGHLLADYADERRRKYRNLHHFWKFGRGWLNRVDRGERSARRLLKVEDKNHQEMQPTKGTDMTTTDERAGTRKWWGSSMTIWGAAITALSTVVPILGPAVGLDVTPDVVRQAGEQFVAVVQAIGGLLGTIMTIYGRTRATHSLVRRQVQVQI